MSLKYDPDVDSKAGVQCVGGEWDTSDMPSTEDCNDDVRIQSYWNSRAFLECPLFLKHMTVQKISLHGVVQVDF